MVQLEIKVKLESDMEIPAVVQDALGNFLTVKCTEMGRVRNTNKDTIRNTLIKELKNIEVTVRLAKKTN